MKIHYFQSAWEDIKHSPGWFGKLCLLALLGLIPIFGQIVYLAYLYGWAREIAWGTYEPMPARIFANEDGKFWRRGWFTFLLTLVFSLIPGIIISIASSIQSTEVIMTWFGPQTSVNPGLAALSTILYIVGYLLMLVMIVFAWVGCMRVAIYDRLSAGFQFGKIWKMIRHDTGGIMRIFGMWLLVTIIISIVLAIALTLLMMVVIFVGLASFGGSLDSLQYLSNNQSALVAIQLIFSAGIVGFICLLVASFIALLGGLFAETLAIRALGYWVMQFDVPLWGGQDDPMPFELNNEPEQAKGFQPPVAPPTPAPHPYGQAYSQVVTPQEQPTIPTPTVVTEVKETNQVFNAALSTDASLSASEAAEAVVAVDEAEAVGIDLSNGLEVVSDNVDANGAETIKEEQNGTTVSYEKPFVVGAEFVLSPEEIEKLKGETSSTDASDRTE